MPVTFLLFLRITDVEGGQKTKDKGQSLTS